MFNVLIKDAKDILKDNKGNPLIFGTGKEAQTFIEKQQLDRRKYIPYPQKVTAKVDWRAREKKKFDDGKYELPDFLAPYALPDHFLHLGKALPNVAYTKSEEKGVLDLQTKISLKGYFEAYHPKLPHKEYVVVSKKFNEFVLSKDGLLFAHTPEEIVKVYRNHNGYANSCMTGGFSRLPVHPTYIYGAGDLAVAYLLNDKGKTISRVIVWPERKIYSRCYGEGNRLLSLLQARGYGPCDYRGNKSFVGARMLIVPTEKTNTRFVVPSIDNGGRFEFNEDKTFFVFQDNGRFYGSANGYTANKIAPVELPGYSSPFREENKEDYWICQRTGARIHSRYKKWVVTRRTGELENWCNFAVREWARRRNFVYFER